MFEMYVTCPTTGQPVYVGVASDAANEKITQGFFLNSICPACGLKHESLAASAWLEIPLAFPEAEVVRQAETPPPAELRSAA